MISPKLSCLFDLAYCSICSSKTKLLSYDVVNQSCERKPFVLNSSTLYKQLFYWDWKQMRLILSSALSI